MQRVIQVLMAQLVRLDQLDQLVFQDQQASQVCQDQQERLVLKVLKAPLGRKDQQVPLEVLERTALPAPRGPMEVLERMEQQEFREGLDQRVPQVSQVPRGFQEALEGSVPQVQMDQPESQVRLGLRVPRGKQVLLDQQECQGILGPKDPMAQLEPREAQVRKDQPARKVQLARQAATEVQGVLENRVKMVLPVPPVLVVPQVRQVLLVLMVPRGRPDNPVLMEPLVLLECKGLQEYQDLLVPKVRTGPLEKVGLQVRPGLRVNLVNLGQRVLSV